MDSFKEINLERMDNEDTMNLEDTDYMSGDELMDQNPDEDEAVAVEDTLMSTSENRRKRGGKCRHSRCWKHFNIIGEKYPDGSNDIHSSSANSAITPTTLTCVMKWILNLWRKLEKKLRKLVKSEFIINFNVLPRVYLIDMRVMN
ncbi:hypothetical protein HID58_052957 [Brassica napus]|uniref:Uncharacterized protein n=1 Tax=Brassica napus TaxID=3708 RepID=A0ABQ8AE51_BRANA|nr:hypothetical protein HID58_052957 [Brassica napus]